MTAARDGDGAVEQPGGDDRGNGLPAQTFEPLADLEPELAAAMLEVFREEGVAARVSAPAADGEGDRLWVDAAELDLARAVLRTRLPILRAERARAVRKPDGEAAADGEAEPPSDAVPAEPDPERAGPADPDSPAGGITAAEQAAWEQLVAVFDEPAAEPPEPRPARTVTDVPLNPKPARPARPSAAAEGPGDTTSGTGEGPRDWSAEEADEHFVPPEPPPLPSGDTTSRLAWFSVLGGPALLLCLALFQPEELGDWPSALGVLLFVGGFATLVVRMRDEDDDDDDPNGGAVV